MELGRCGRQVRARLGREAWQERKRKQLHPYAGQHRLPPPSSGAGARLRWLLPSAPTQTDCSARRHGARCLGAWILRTHSPGPFNGGRVLRLQGWHHNGLVAIDSVSRIGDHPNDTIVIAFGWPSPESPGSSCLRRYATDDGGSHLSGSARRICASARLKLVSWRRWVMHQQWVSTPAARV